MAAGRREKLVFGLYRSFWAAADWVYPPACAGCGRPGARWCEACEAQTQLITGPVCPVCGLPARQESLCPRCRRRRPAFTALRSWARYSGPLREAVQRFKYRRDLGLAEPFAERLCRLYRSTGWAADLVTCVPLGRLRQRERGYNQAKELSYPFAAALGMPFAPQAITRFRETRSQVGLSAAERISNLEGAFRADSSLVSGKRVLVIDDVATTGATTHAAAQSLLAAGAVQVYALTLARAVRLADHSDPVSGQ
ncbi:MAG TPA: ComF family protein [Chloroflexi bacterium]|nr:ComF family protein [Chloroflexota bacterium]